MQKTTDTRRKKMTASICAIVMILIFAAYLAIFLYPLIAEEFTELIVVLIFAFYALVIIAAIAGVLLALKQRLREIDSGEEDEAKRY